MTDKSNYTIYDILPMLETEILKLLTDFIGADGGAFYTWEATIFIPATNAYLHYLSGVNFSLKNDNYMSAMANLRGLIEALGAIAYDGTAKLPQEAYEWFMKKGRLPKRNPENTGWATLSVGDSITSAQQFVDSKIKLKKIYAACCDINHFSSKHMSFLAGFDPQVDEDEHIVGIKIGSKDDIPAKEQREIIDFCATLTNVLGGIMRIAIAQKVKRSADGVA